jgi:hypothetical protein
VLVLASKAAFGHRFNPDNKQWTSPASRNRSNAATIENRESWNKTFPQQVFSLAARSRFVPMRDKNMRQNCIQSKNAKSLPLVIGIRMARLLSLAAVAFGLAASLSPKPVHAQEYPWCVSRESYLYCFYETQEQCRWTASGIGGCALNPRLLFPNKPRDSDQNLLSRKK